jgi:hypothetical protein
MTPPGMNIAETIQRYRGRLQENPGSAETWVNLGNLLQHIQHYNAALGCLDRALEISPANANVLSNRGNVLISLDRLEESVDSHRAAYAAAPDDSNIRYNLAIALRTSGRTEESLAHLEALSAQEPENEKIKFERSIALLHLARFGEAWEAYEARWSRPYMNKRKSTKPLWNGEDLTGKTILIYEEQGFGDTIFCSRYIPLVKARGGRVIFECKKALHRLFQSVPGIDKITEAEKSDDAFDYQVPAMSLLRIFETDLQSIPPVVPLSIPASPPDDAARLLERGKNRFRVGIVWSGNTAFTHNYKRAVHASRFLPLAEIPGVQLYSLQKGPCEKELGECGGRSLIWEMGPHLNDFADTAAVLKNLDLVIMTDSSVAHLAGTVGCPVWNLLYFWPYWIYGNRREDSPWYSSMRLLRQPDSGNWDALFKTTAEELKKAVALKKAGKWKGTV